MFKNVKILEFGGYFWNHHKKCIQISTNMPGIGLEIWETIRFCIDGETDGIACISWFNVFSSWHIHFILILQK